MYHNDHYGNQHNHMGSWTLCCDFESDDWWSSILLRFQWKLGLLLDFGRFLCSRASAFHSPKICTKSFQKLDLGILWNKTGIKIIMTMMMVKNKKITGIIKDTNKIASGSACLYWCYNYWRYHHQYQFFIAIITGVIIAIVVFAAFVDQCQLGTRQHLCVFVWKRVHFDAFWPFVRTEMLENGCVFKWTRMDSKTPSKVETTIKNRAFLKQWRDSVVHFFVLRPPVLNTKQIWRTSTWIYFWCLSSAWYCVRSGIHILTNKYSKTLCTC